MSVGGAAEGAARLAGGAIARDEAGGGWPPAARTSAERSATPYANLPTADEPASAPPCPCLQLRWVETTELKQGGSLAGCWCLQAALPALHCSVPSAALALLRAQAACCA